MTTIAEYGISIIEEDLIAAARGNRSGGYVIAEDNFGDYTNWTGTAATSGTGVNGSPGLVLSAGAATADQGYQIQLTKFGVTPKAGLKAVFKAILSVTSPTNLQFFAGLALVDTTVFSISGGDAGENSTANHVGFEMNATSQAATPGVCKFYSENGGTRSTLSVNPLTFVADTVYDLCFVVNGLTSVDVYVNDVKMGSITSNIPAGSVLVPTFVCKAEGGSGTPTVTILRHVTAVDYGSLVSNLSNRLNS